MCKFSEFIKDLSQCVSVLTLTALSVNKYSAVAEPLRKFRESGETKLTIIGIIGIWILATLFALPSAIFSYIREFPEYDLDENMESAAEEKVQYETEENSIGRTLKVCYPYPAEFGVLYAQVMVMFHFLVYYAVPLVFIATFHIKTARHLVESARQMPGEMQGQGNQVQARKKVAKMILSFAVIFAICFLPHHMFLLWFYFYPDSEESFNDFWHACRIVGFCLSFANSCINPITLYFTSSTFRKQFQSHLCSCLVDETGHFRGNCEICPKIGCTFICVSVVSVGNQNDGHCNLNVEMVDLE